MSPTVATGVPTSRLRPLARLVAAVFGLYAAFSIGLGLYVAHQNTYVYRRPLLFPVSAFDDRAREVEFPARDGLVIRGTLVPPGEGRPILVVQHGRRRNRENYLPWASVLARAGYGILAFDWRAHGKSDGDRIALGTQEPLDLLGAIDFLASRHPDRPVGLVGASLGACAISMAAPDLPERVRALVLDSPYGNLERMVDFKLAGIGPARLGPSLVLDLFCRIRYGESPSEVRPEDRLKGFAPRPVLLMHGDQDDVIPVSEGRSIAKVYPGPIEYWETAGDKHCASRTNRTREWMAKVAGFLARHLEGAPPPEVVLELTPNRLESVNG